MVTLKELNITPAPKQDLQDLQHAKRFEEKHNVRGIAGHWKFPEELRIDGVALLQRLEYLHNERKIEEVEKQSEEMKRQGMKLEEIRKSVFDKVIQREEGVPYAEFINPVYERLLLDNRELRTIEILNDAEKRGVVQGVIYGYNFDDIKYFIERRRMGAQCLTWEPEIKRLELEKQVKEKLGIKSTRWIACQSTLENIWEQIKDRPNAQAQAQTVQQPTPVSPQP